MLDPRNRQLLLSSLRPPDGYQFDCAIGTTYSLDLIALLTTPLAFAMFDWHNDRGGLASDPASPTSDPLALLESLRRCADRIHLFCHAGQIKVPPAHQRLLAYLERAVIEVQPPTIRSGGRGVFHPKVWVIRYLTSDGPVKYRLVCLSRNLTFDRSWDTVLLLDGEVADRTRPIGSNSPLVDFVTALPAMALRIDAVRKQASDDVQQISRELAIVKWENPEHIDEIRFWPMGIDNKMRTGPFTERMERVLVISPFVSEDFLNRIVECDGDRFLVSRLESLQALPRAALIDSWRCFTLDEGLEENPAEAAPAADAPDQEILTGLHAKVFVADAGWDAHVWTGSANATTAAFGGNVEFLVELIGKKSKIGIDATIGDDKTGANFQSMLVPFVPDEKQVMPDGDEQAAELAANEARELLTALPWTATIAEADSGFKTHVESPKTCLIPENVSVRCRPALLGRSDEQTLTDAGPVALCFGPHARESISSFVAFDVVARVGSAQHRASFVLNLPLIGAPSDRKEQLLRDLLKDSRTLLRFLLMLLSDDPEQLIQEMSSFITNSTGGPTNRSADLFPLLEHLLQALDQSPKKLESVGRLIEDLRRTPEGRSILPVDFDLVWEPIRRVHCPDPQPTDVPK